MSVKASGRVDRTAVADAELNELLQQFGRVTATLKRGGSPMPAALAQAHADECLGPRHGRVLLAVALEGDLSVSELAERIGLGVPATSLMVGELSRAGVLERAEDERDRRRTLVRLHPDHAAEVERWMAERITPFRHTLERLSPTARAHFLEGWRVLEEEMRRLEADAGAEGTG